MSKLTLFHQVIKTMKNNLEIKEKWGKTILKDIVSDIVDNRGKTPPNNYLGGKKMIETYQISRGSVYPLNGGKKQKYVDEETFFSWFRSGHPKDNDILFTTVGEAVPQFCLVPKDNEFCIAQNLVALRFDENKINPLFILYYFRQKKFIKEVINRMIITAQPSIKIPHLLGIEMEIPKLLEQKEIASVLSSLDDKIELLKKQNETLEEIAKTIFKEWFIEFNFPNEKGQPYKSSGGKMIDSELGKIPEEWNVGTVSDFIERQAISYRCDKKDLDEKGKIPIIDQGANGLYGYTNREADFKANSRDPVVLFTNHTCNMWLLNYPFCAIQNVIPFKGGNGYNTVFAFYMTLGRVTFKEYKGHWPDFEYEKYVISNVKLANNFVEIIKPFQQKLWDIKFQIQSLSKTKDILLPKLMNGEIRVK